MTAASSLPPEFARRTDWTVDDLAGLPPDLDHELIKRRWVSPSPTAFHQGICFEIVAGFNLSIAVDRRNEPRPDVAVVPLRHAGVSPDYGGATSDLYTTGRPWKVTLDLPALSAGHKAMREHANASDHQ